MNTEQNTAIASPTYQPEPEWERLEIGGSPCEEDCAALGVTEDFERLNRAECRAYIAALSRFYGEAPTDSWYLLNSNPHEFGTYREAAIRYNANDKAGREYAWRVESGLLTWEQAGMWAPVKYDNKSQAIHRIADEALCKAKNPKAHPNKAAAVEAGDWFEDAVWVKPTETPAPTPDPDAVA